MPLEVFSQKNFVAHLIQLKLTFIPKKGKVRFLSHPLEDFINSSLESPSVYDFLFVTIELFSLALTVETLQAEICRRKRFVKGGGSLQSPIKGGRDVAHQPLLGGRKLEGLPFHLV